MLQPRALSGSATGFRGAVGQGVSGGVQTRTAFVRQPVAIVVYFVTGFLTRHARVAVVTVERVAARPHAGPVSISVRAALSHAERIDAIGRARRTLVYRRAFSRRGLSLGRAVAAGSARDYDEQGYPRKERAAPMHHSHMIA
jgi:hypothetical protein